MEETKMDAVSVYNQVKTCLKELPDIILSDILMPEMDGKEFCKQIKQDIHTCHIPFIMLTEFFSVHFGHKNVGQYNVG